MRVRPWNGWLSLLSIGFLLSLWWVSTGLGWVDPLFVPSPRQVWAAFVDICREGYKGSPLAVHIGESLKRLLLAFLMALATAIPLGLLSGYSPKARALVDPLIEFYRPLPPLAYYTLLVLWLGIGDSSKIALLFLAAFAPLYIAVAAGVARIPRDRILAARSLGASRAKVFAFVIFPSCLPDIFTGIRTAMGMAYTTLVAAEMVAAVSGVGWMVLDASKFLRSDIIFVGIGLMGLIAVLLDLFIRWLARTQVPWNGKE
ncbi:ABC transporter permease subunit [Cohnella fermenti]|uniref:ABC transporter permease subunit n=1 Tax=Cohnella fermenti TaxID=2565925 RepID=A0A4S4BH51_9BACL|nr:ABC transporter permease subunit [Cohnella fermenti]THF73844.1 ABC transporter permease subunit [Cohnella fermenti]